MSSGQTFKAIDDVAPRVAATRNTFAEPPEDPASVIGLIADDVSGPYSGATIVAFLGLSVPIPGGSSFGHCESVASEPDDPRAEQVYQLETLDGVIFERFWRDIENVRSHGDSAPVGYRPAGQETPNPRPSWQYDAGGRLFVREAQY